jgi:hypothetical protein
MNLVKYFQSIRTDAKKIVIISILFITPGISNAQPRMTIGIHADPLISWFSSDIMQIRSDGPRAGFNFGVTFNNYFTPNYAFSTGISLIRAGGRLASSDTTLLELSKSTYKILPGNPVIYKIQYLSFPFGLKLQTNQIGYVRFFSDLGLDPKIVISRKADIPSLSVVDENAANQLRLFNLSYHVTAGIEYSFGGTTALVFGLNFDNNFLDITKDKGNQPSDNVSNKMLSFRLGVNF